MDAGGHLCTFAFMGPAYLPCYVQLTCHDGLEKAIKAQRTHHK